MSDDSPFPPEKRVMNANSLANLRPHRKGEPSPNKTGFNGRTRSEVIAAFLEEKDDTPLGKSLMAKVGCPDGSRIRGLLHREWLAGMGKSDMARKTMIEQYGGKPRMQMDVTNDDGSLSAGLAAVLGMNSEQRAAMLAEMDAKRAAYREAKPDGGSDK